MMDDKEWARMTPGEQAGYNAARDRAEAGHRGSPCPCDCKKLPEFTKADVLKVLDYAGHAGLRSLRDPYTDVEHEDIVNDIERLRVGMNEEREHCDITHGDPVLTARIALAHLREDPEYYVKLKKAGL
jgi:hypothetical protein